MSLEKSPYYLDQKKIQAFLPHRPPFLLVDRILDIIPDANQNFPMDDADMKHKVGIKVIGQKNVSMNEPFFTGHFPDMPVMPGVLIIETMAQVGSFAMYPYGIRQIIDHGESYQCLLVGVNEARFRIPVVPGDVLRIETTVEKCRTSMWSFSCQAFVEDRLVAEANIMANLFAGSQRKVL